jgi:hypothetical protein
VFAPSTAALESRASRLSLCLILGQVLKTVLSTNLAGVAFITSLPGRIGLIPISAGSELLNSYGIMADTSVELALSVPLPSTDRTT